MYLQYFAEIFFKEMLLNIVASFSFFYSTIKI